MKYDSQKYHRRSIRLKGYDYTQPGAYFVTMVTWKRQELFGEVVEGEMRLNDYGCIVEDTWRWLSDQYAYIELGAWVVMPNHVHGILIIHEIDGRGGSRPAPTQTAPTQTAPTVKPLGQLVGAFKTVSARQINLIRGTSGASVWQGNYYEHIIRNETDWERIHLYIQSNPTRWESDQLHPSRQA